MPDKEEFDELQDIFGTESEPQDSQQPQTADAESQQAAETGDKQDAAATPAEANPDNASESDEPPHVPRTALLDERKKRQELERKLADAERRLTGGGQQPQTQQQQQQQPATLEQAIEQILGPRPDPYTDPAKFAEYQTQEFQIRLEVNNRQMAARMYQQAVAIDLETLQSQHTDVDEIVGLAAAEAAKDPRLQEQITQSARPGLTAYQIGRRLKLMQEIGDDPDAYRAKLEAEFRQKHGLEGDSQQQQSPAQQDKPNAAPVPSSLGKTTSQQPRNPKNGRWEGPPDLEDLLG